MQGCARRGAVITEGLKIPEEQLLPAHEKTFMTWPEVKDLYDLGGGAGCDFH